MSIADSHNKVMEELSLRLYSVLEHIGASDDLRKLHRDTAVTQEILSTIGFSVRCNILVKTYHCGSSYEGTKTPDLTSDVDIVICDNIHPVVPDVQSSPPGWSLLIVRDPWAYPGHVKLQCVLNGRPCDVSNRKWWNSDLDWSGRMCWKHFPGRNMHGPAEMTVDENGVHTVDRVYALKCKRIPAYALKWFKRERPYGWPSQEQLHDMTRMGCMFVGAGYVYSGEKEIEWKLSFVLQERQMMSELSPVQNKVYVLLKLIKRNILGDIFNEETLTSYHCKTCILFAVQMTPATAWTEENLINCLLQCMQLLIMWIEQGNCPNHLIQYQNLFIKEGFPHHRRRLLSVMRLIVETDTHFLYMIQSDNIGDLLRKRNLTRFREIKKNEHVFSLKAMLLRWIITMPLRLSIGVIDPFGLARVLDALKGTETLNEHSVEVTQSSLAYLYPFFHLHTASCVVFLLTELKITPVPLQYEMMRSEGALPASRDDRFNFWFDWAVVDPNIYLYFMQYLVTCKLCKEAHKKLAVNNLQAAIDKDNGQVRSGRESRLAHKETAYNLLGWILVQEGSFSEAFLCFTESWKIRPYHNAAKFHMCNLAAKLTNIDG